MSTIYQQRGFDDRNGYLKAVADQYGMDFDQVDMLADLLGMSEDFDGLLSECADWAGTTVMEVG